MGEYIPQAGQNPSKLGDRGGIYNTINFHCFAYAENNPIIMRDPNGRKNVFDDPKVIRTSEYTGRKMTTPDSAQTTPVQGNSPLASISGRISMQEAFGSDNGPCFFRSLLAIAETKEGKNLTSEQIQRIYNKSTSNEWSNASPSFSVNSPVNIINSALEELGSDFEAEYLGSFAPGDALPINTEATAIHRNPNLSTGKKFQHWGEGDAQGKLIFDPLGYDTFTGEKIDDIRAFGFKIKDEL